MLCRRKLFVLIILILRGMALTFLKSNQVRITCIFTTFGASRQAERLGIVRTLLPGGQLLTFVHSIVKWRHRIFRLLKAELIL